LFCSFFQGNKAHFNLALETNGKVVIVSRSKNAEVVGGPQPPGANGGSGADPPALRQIIIFTVFQKNTHF